MSTSPRLQFVQNFLTQVLGLQPTVINRRNSTVFELYCYFKKVEWFVRRGKMVRINNVPRGIFRPNLGPNTPTAGSYISLTEAQTATFDLVLNGQFRGKSGADHSPDITLIERDSGLILSIYECKLHALHLNLRYCREFLGFLNELRIPNQKYVSTTRDLYPELRSSIFTSASKPPSAIQMQSKYDFDIVDRL
jgi:hypothetical protein